MNCTKHIHTSSNAIASVLVSNLFDKEFISVIYQSKNISHWSGYYIIQRNREITSCID